MINTIKKVHERYCVGIKMKIRKGENQRKLPRWRDIGSYRIRSCASQKGEVMNHLYSILNNMTSPSFHARTNLLETPITLYNFAKIRQKWSHPPLFSFPSQTLKNTPQFISAERRKFSLIRTEACPMVAYKTEMLGFFYPILLSCVCP